MSRAAMSRTLDEEAVPLSRVGDFIALTKPRILLLTSFTAWCGMVLAQGQAHWVLQIIILLAIATGAAGAGALNMWYDRDIDPLMSRTRRRPIACGRVSASDGLVFGMLLSMFAVLLLTLSAGLAAGGLLAFSIGFYVVVYSMLLKRRTAQNIVIGGAAGAFPPMIGWIAAGPSPVATWIDPVLLFVVIFLWTPPHFWALALLRSQDYRRAQIPMLPIVHGEQATRRQILYYAVLLLPASLSLGLVGSAGLLYVGLATLLSMRFLLYAVKLNSLRKQKQRDKVARTLFKFSIVYLFLLFASLMLDHFIDYEGLL